MFRPISAGYTVGEETVKRRLARAGSPKYAMHGPNETLRETTLRDESPVYEFIRCNPHWGGVSSCDQGRCIGDVLTESFLNRLVERGGNCILYTHLGKIDNPRIPFELNAIRAFRRLADEHHAGRILVTTTRRLLGYRRALSEITYSSTDNGERTVIHISRQKGKNSAVPISRSDLDGLTFYVSDPGATRIVVDGIEAVTTQCNRSDHTGKDSISLPWPRLEFPHV